ncbi:structural maintenance of chromosomes protein 6 [Neosynchiropus ocellatus]
MSKRKSTSIRDNNSKRPKPRPDVDDGDDAEELCTPSQSMLRKQLAVPSNPVTDAGIVESITLRNFMCHSLLGPFTFSPNVNFVVGNNGTGKSAVLTALIVALGGNAQATSRASSLKDFIKNGESSADVSVTLRNQGTDAYKPELYGSSIVVDLRITREGARTYKLRSKSGQVVSTKKEELVSMLDNFNIQVNNPVTVLNQEMSKFFLHSKGEGDKYKFFMKATHLDQMNDDIAAIKSAQAVTRDKLDQHCECLKELKQKYKEKEECYKNLASFDEMHAKLEELRKQMAWALVEEMEKQLVPMMDKLQAERRSTVKYDEKVEEWKNKTKEAEGRYKSFQEDLEGITQKVQELQPKSSLLKADAQKLNTVFKSSEVNVHRHMVTLRDLEKDRTQLTTRINDLKYSISQTSGSELEAKKQRMEQILTEVESMNLHISTLGQQIDQYEHACTRAKEEQEKLRMEQLSLQKSISANGRRLQTLESSRSNRLRRFGDNMLPLLNAIDEAYRRGQFKEKPRGPLGYLISLKQPDMALAVEVCLKSLLQAFICDNHDDERVLQGLMAKVCSGGRRPMIITSRFLPSIHDTTRRQAFLSSSPSSRSHAPARVYLHRDVSFRAVNHPKYPSVLQALEIEDHVVANCLIDQRGIESVLLIKDRAEARSVMQDGTPPRNCSQAFSQEGDQIFPNRTYTSDQNRVNYLSGDVEEEIRHLRKEMENQKAQEARFDQQVRRLSDDIRQNQVLQRKTHMEQKSTKNKTTKLQLELTDLQNVEEPQSEDLKPLEEDLQEIEGKIAQFTVESEEAKAQMAKHKASHEKAEQEYKRHKDQISVIAEEADQKKEELSKTDQEVMKCQHHKKHYDEKRSAHLQNIQSLEDSVRKKEQEIEASVSKATEICPDRTSVSRSAKSLDMEINRLKVKISTQQEMQGDKEEIVRQYHEAMVNYKNMSQEIKNLKTFSNTLHRVWSNRVDFYSVFRSFLSARCKYLFDSMLAQRGYSGRMIFDHKEQTLTLSVTPGQGSEGDMSDMRSLSGGERSFSTVCFVLSLWGITETPFRCLDEFDVYMDMVNRRISVDMMLEVALSQTYRQFIFLTPLSMSFIPESSDIRIIRFEKPAGEVQDEDVEK